MYGVGLEKDSQGLVVREVPEPFIEADNQVLVKVLYAGTCNTDRNMINYADRTNLESGIVYGGRSRQPRLSWRKGVA